MPQGNKKSKYHVKDGQSHGTASHPITSQHLAQHQQSHHNQMKRPSERVQDFQRSAASYEPGQRPSAKEGLKQWTEHWNKLEKKK